MQALKGGAPQKTQTATTEVTPKDILELKFFFAGLLMANKSYSGTVAMWQTKNEKKLTKVLKQCQADDKAIDAKYIQQNDKGHFKLWDKVEGGFHCWMKERENGTIAFVDDNGDELPDMDKEMFFKVADPNNQEEYEKAKEDYSSTKRKVHVVQIDPRLIENLNIPTMGSAQQGSVPRKLNRELFYDTMVMPDDEEEDENEAEEKE